MLGVNVKGGTRAGWRRVLSTQKKDDWVCPLSEGGCGKSLRYYWTRCPNCGHPKPETHQH
jgi:hypothetical protein